MLTDQQVAIVGSGALRWPESRYRLRRNARGMLGREVVMVRILVRALLKGEQLGMFGGAKPEAPKPVAPGTPVTIKAHIRHGAHGFEAVKEHERHVVKAAPKPEPEPSGKPGEFDAAAYAREVLKLKRAEIDARLRDLPKDDPRRKVIADELRRRETKRTGTTPTGTATAKLPEAPKPEPAAPEAPKKAEPTTPTGTATTLDATKPGDAYLDKMDTAMASAKPGAWGPLLDLYAHPSKHAELSAWLDKYAPDAEVARNLLDGKDNAPGAWSLDEVARRLGIAHVNSAVKSEGASQEANAETKDKTTPTTIEPPSKSDEIPGQAPAEKPAGQEERQEPYEPKSERSEVPETAEDIAKRGEGALADVGEVLWGARKHKWKKGEAITLENLDDVEAMGDEVARKAVTKAAVFGEFSHEDNRQLGDTAGASFLKEKILGAVSSAPGPHAEPRRWYVEGGDWLQHELDQYHTVADVKQFLADWNLMASGHMVQQEKYTAKEVLDLVKPYINENAKYESHAFVYDYTEMTAETHTYGDKTITHMKPKRIDIPISALSRAGFSSEVVRAYAKDEHGTETYRLTKPLDPKSNPYSRYLFGLAGIDGIPDGASRRKLKSNRLVAAVVGAGVIHDEHMATARLHEKNEAAGADVWSTISAAKARGKGAQAKRWERAFSGVMRTGGAPVPAMVDSDTLRDEFKLRGVQSGNWVEDEARSEHMKHAMGALMDLADLVGIPHSALSHGGKLGFSFGARGGGWASAHYEPSTVVINLTHTRGAGTLAHEWGHFFDHQLTENPTAWVSEGANRTRAPFLSHGEGHGAVHPDVSKAFKDVMFALHVKDSSPKNMELHDAVKAATEARDAFKGSNADKYGHKYGEWSKLNQAVNDAHNALVAYKRERDQGKKVDPHTKFYKDANALGKYWERPHEMFARAWESHIEDKLEAAGRRNTYLVSGTQTRYNIPSKDEKSAVTHEPYPQDEERKNISRAMDKLIDAMAKHGALRKATRLLISRLIRRVAA